MTTVFVYGTLKRGGSNHAFLGRQRFLGEARTMPGFTLYSLGDYPGMVRAPGDTAGVTGELWVIDEGLKPGERIVVEGVQKVRAGVKVKPVAVTIEEQGAKPVATTDAGLAEKK